MAFVPGDIESAKSTAYQLTLTTGETYTGFVLLNEPLHGSFVFLSYSEQVNGESVARNDWMYLTHSQITSISHN